MASGANFERHTEEMGKNSKLEPSFKAGDSALPPAKDGVLSDATSCISSVDAVGSVKESELDQESLTSEQAMYYPANNYCGYYYPGLENSYVDWNDPNYFVGAEGLGTQQPVLQSDGGYMYYMPGFTPDYSPYNAYMHGAVIDANGQYLGQQPYVFSPVISQSLGSPGYFSPPVAYGSELIPAYSWDTTVWDGFNGNVFDGTLALSAPKTKSSKMQPSKNNNSTAKSGTSVDKKGQSPVLELPPGSEVPKISLKPISKAPVQSKGYYPASKMPTYTYQGKPGLLYPNTPGSIKDTGRNWVDAEKPKARNKNGLGDFELLSEQNRGPRTNNSKTSWVAGVNQSGLPVADTDDKCGNKSVIIRRDDYNLPDFPTKYEDAMFFVIKSYSEDDIHKSIKYKVWASTPNGNKRLDNAYQAAQEKMNEKGNKCSIFLFFSVNASGQFCGVAEMIGRVDFNKNMDFWQQDKWNGFFPVKWHIIKDVPNPQFRHIILENNENKPVTNSRDTQEVKFPQGVEMLNIFKNFSSKTSILDDFVFYENRQKVMQEKRTKFYIPLEQMQPKVEETAQDQKAEDLNPIITGLESMDLGNGMKKKELQVAVVG